MQPQSLDPKHMLVFRVEGSGHRVRGWSNVLKVYSFDLFSITNNSEPNNRPEVKMGSEGKAGK